MTKLFTLILLSLLSLLVYFKLVLKALFALFNPQRNTEMFHLSLIKWFSISQQASKSHGVEGMCGRQSPDNVIWTCNYSCSVFWSSCGHVLVSLCPTCGCYGCNRRQSPEASYQGDQQVGFYFIDANALIYRTLCTNCYRLNTWEPRAAIPAPNTHTHTPPPPTHSCVFMISGDINGLKFSEDSPYS